MAQFSQPVSDIETSGWTVVPLFPKLAGPSPDDTTLVQATAAADFEVGLGAVTDPAASTGHVVRVRAAGRGKLLTVTLKQASLGTPAVATFNQTLSGKNTTYNFTIANADADKITDYADLSVLCSSNGATLVTWIQLEVPASSADSTPPAAPTGLGAVAGSKQATLNWVDNAEPDFARYTVYRSTDQTNWVTLGDVVTSDYVATGLTNGTIYYFEVTASDATGNESVRSSRVNATPVGSTFSGAVSLLVDTTYSQGIVDFDPAVDTTVTVKGGHSLIINGTATLRMRPNAGKTHTLIFESVDESKFVGGGTVFLATDPGLWVLDSAKLDIEGAPRVGWIRSANASDATWEAGDELRTAPNVAGDYTTFNTIALNAATPTAITTQWGTQYTETFNLTRTVVIKGTASGRTHIFIKSDQPQHVWYAKIQYTGPRQNDAVVLGRYGLHLHHCGSVFGEGLRDGGIDNPSFKGLVAQNSANWSFAPHDSHGTTWYDCLGYDVTDDTFAWDFPPPDSGLAVEETHDTTWEHCHAFKINPRGPQTGRIAGFTLAKGNPLTNTVRDCGVAGQNGAVDSSGFRWVSGPAIGIWIFEDNMTHNCRVHPWHVWQNDTFDTHTINNFKSYHCGTAGLMGAYDNNYVWNDSKAYKSGPLNQQSTSDGSPNLMEYVNFNWDGTGGSSGYAIIIKEATTAGTMRFTDPILKGYTIKVLQVNQPRPFLGTYQFVRPRIGVGGADMEAGDITWTAAPVGLKVQVQRQNNATAWQATKTTTGVAVIAIPPFAPAA